MTLPQNIRPVPITGEWTGLRMLLQDMRTALLSLQSSVMPPSPITNLKATGKAGGAIIQFTRSDADSYILYTNTVPEIGTAVRVDIGLANEYSDDIGAGSVKKYYWVKAKKNQIESTLVGPVNATSLALGSSISFPTPPPGTQMPTKSDETQEISIGRPTGAGYQKV